MFLFFYFFYLFFFNNFIYKTITYSINYTYFVLATYTTEIILTLIMHTLHYDTGITILLTLI